MENQYVKISPARVESSNCVNILSLHDNTRHPHSAFLCRTMNATLLFCSLSTKPSRTQPRKRRFSRRVMGDGRWEMRDDNSMSLGQRTDADTISFYTHDDRAGQRNCNYVSVALCRICIFICICICIASICISVSPTKASA